MKIEYWPHRGAFEDSKRDKQCFESLSTALEYVVNSHLDFTLPPFNKDDLYIYHYGYDPRVKNECFALCVGRYYNENYIEKYKCPQIIGFLCFESFEGSDENNSTRYIESVVGKAAIRPGTLNLFLTNNFDVSAQDIIIDGKYCHFVCK